MARKCVGEGFPATILLFCLVCIQQGCARPEPFAAPVIRDIHARVDQILIISIDAMRPDHLSCYGYDRPTTPAIDSIARDGIRFTRAYTQANWTKPAIASLFTGLYQRHHGVTVGSTLIEPDGSVQKGVKTYPLPEGLPVISETFSASGFRAAGYVENSHIVPAQGFARGFEHYERSKPATRAIQKWLEGLEPDERAFGFIHLIGPHDPYDRADRKKYVQYRQQFPTVESEIDFTKLDYKKRKDLTDKDIQAARTAYDTELSYFDGEFVAPLLAWLRQTDRYDRFLIVVTSDHGEELYDHQGWAHGHSLFEEVTRVPLIIKPPKNLQISDPSSELKVDEIVELIDIYPTLADLAGLDAPNNIDGKSIVSLLRGERPVDPMAFAISEYGRSFASHLLAAAIVQGANKLIERYDVPYGPKVSGFGRHAESRSYQLIGMEERALMEISAAETTARLKAVLHEAVGVDNAVVPHDQHTIFLSDEEVEHLKALGYLEESP